MTAFQLAGVALAALLSENFILVNCLGIGTRTKAFQDPLDAFSTLHWATFRPWCLPWWDRLW